MAAQDATTRPGTAWHRGSDRLLSLDLTHSDGYAFGMALSQDRVAFHVDVVTATYATIAIDVDMDPNRVVCAIVWDLSMQTECERSSVGRVIGDTVDDLLGNADGRGIHPADILQHDPHSGSAERAPCLNDDVTCEQWSAHFAPRIHAGIPGS
jgi:hypothetical protein